MIRQNHPPTFRAHAAGRLICALLAVCSVALAVQTLRYGLADLWTRSSDEASRRRAARWAPGFAPAWMGVAESECTTGDAETCQRDLRAALAANPLLAAGWIQLAVETELDGDAPRAREMFERAVRLDRGFDARWAFVNFLARQKDPRAWNVLSGALWIPGILDADADNLFMLCDRLQANSDLILNRVVGSNSAAAAMYARYLVRKRRTDELEKAVTQHPPADAATVLETCDYLVMHHRWAPATALWRSLTGPAPAQKNLVTNAAFQTERMGHGFDWRFNSTLDGRVSFDPYRAAMRADLDGYQPDYLELLYQYVPVTAGQRYAAGFSIQPAPAANAELQCSVMDADSGAALASAAGPLTFTAPVGTAAVRLVFSERRPRGETPFTGTFWLSHPSVEAVRD